MKKTLEGVSRDKPMFLFVNISDAHQPWSPVPEGLDWVPPQTRVGYVKTNENGRWRRYVEGRMEDAEAKPYLDSISNLYDYGMYQADKNLGAAVALLENEGWCPGGCRFVIVSDHGEFLGDHGLLDHGNYVYEEMVRVPLVTAGWKIPPLVPRVVNAAQVFHLVRDGALPKTPMRVKSAAWPHMRRCEHTGGKAFCSTSAAVWNGAEKLLFKDGKFFYTNLEKDPLDLAPEPLSPSHPRFEMIRSYAQKVVADTWNDPPTGDAAEKEERDLEAQLKALGYWN
jgi:hypothetical protein